jgi:hypothetical protein
MSYATTNTIRGTNNIIIIGGSIQNFTYHIAKEWLIGLCADLIPIRD